MMVNFDPIGSLVQEIKSHINYFEEILFPDVSIFVGILISVVFIIKFL
jgi:hypothetical protein